MDVKYSIPEGAKANSQFFSKIIEYLENNSGTLGEWQEVGEVFRADGEIKNSSSTYNFSVILPSTGSYALQRAIIAPKELTKGIPTQVQIMYGIKTAVEVEEPIAVGFFINQMMFEGDLVRKLEDFDTQVTEYIHKLSV